MVQSSTRTTYQHARHGFHPQIDRAAIHRIDYLNLGNLKFIESQPHKWEVKHSHWHVLLVR